MTSQPSSSPISLFYSYCHRNKKYRQDMEKSLALLKRKKLLADFSDLSIDPGRDISKKTREKMNEADIMVFLVSRDFIASDECMNEWKYAKQLSEKGNLLFRIPIILADCPWQDMLEESSDKYLKALPEDGKPIAVFDDENVAWQQVYEGIKAVIDNLRNTFTPKQEFLKEIEETEFLSQKHIKLRDIFVFLPMSCYNPQKEDGQVRQVLEEKITNQEQLIEKKLSIVHGEDMSGKTALSRHLFLHLAKRSEPVLYMDLREVSVKAREKSFKDEYSRQFNGDYSLWKSQGNKTLILDNLNSSPNLIKFVVFAKDFFDRIVVTLSSDVFYSFFRDETRLADFCEIKINPMTRKQQEQLIRKRLALSDRKEPVTDGFVDQVERNVNSIITKKIVPRYPFFVLAALQIYEGWYMPSSSSLSITSHITSQGQCYYVLIVAHLKKAGILGNEKNVNTCFNFAEKLAFHIYNLTTENRSMNTSDFEEFVKGYNFYIPESILNRLTHRDYGLITKDGCFKMEYVYYFFLGRFLGKNMEEHKAVVEEMGRESYVTSNYLTLLFIIHHTNDSKIIEDILIRTMCALDNVSPATLDATETKKFRSILDALPKSILSSEPVEEQREKQKEALEITDDQEETEKKLEKEAEQTGDENPVNDCYRILKNNEILGQIIRTQYGSLEKPKIKEIVETIADGGLRLVNSFAKDDEDIAEYASYLHEKYPKYDFQNLKNVLVFLSFLWTATNIEKIVSNVNQPEIMEAVDEVVLRRSTPAYDLIGYFSLLDSSKELTEKIKKELEILLKKHNDLFVKSILSIRTQHYINTHRGEATVEQSICSLLDVKYIPRHKSLE